MKKILLVLALLTLAFSSAQACEPCGEIKILPTQNLESCPMGESKTVEVLIYNPEYCYSNITDITLSDDVNFDLNRSFGDVPCGDASTFNMRGYQYCTVGLTFKPTTTSGTFSTDIQVTDRDTGLHSVTVEGKVKVCCHKIPKPVQECTTGTCDGKVTQLTLQNLGNAGTITVTEKKTGNEIFNDFVATGDTFTFNGSDDKGTMGTEIYIAINGIENVAIHTSCSKPIGPDMVFGDFKVISGYSRNGGLLGGINCPSNTSEVNYLASLNLVRPTSSTHVYVDNKTLVFDEYYESNEGLATIALDAPVDFLSRLTFDVNQTAGLFMPRVSGDNGSYYTTDIRKTNRYGFMFPTGKVLDELNFTTWGVGFSGVVSNLSLVEISDLNQSSTQNSDVTCVCYKKHSHKKCHKKHNAHKKCHKGHKHSSHTKCHKEHKHNAHKTCKKAYKKESYKSWCKDFKRNLHKSCSRD